MLAAAALLAALAAPAPAASLKPSGYIKELFQSSRSAFDGRPYTLSTSRARLTLDGAAGIGRAHVDYDHELLAGSQFRTLEYQRFGLGETPQWLTMEQNISTSATHIYRHKLYRGWIGVEEDWGVFRFGRQRIAWGSGKFWNPTDILNPYKPLSLERDERRGVDAFYTRIALGTLSQFEGVLAEQENWSEASLLGRLKSNWKDTDGSFVFGKVAGSTSSFMLGGDLAGNAFDGTLHAEWSYTDPMTRTSFWKAGVGYDYNFSAEAPWGLGDAAVVFEYFHNGAGAINPARYDLVGLLSGRTVQLARDYLGFSYSNDIHPLVKLELVALGNLNDRSTFLSPSLQWNALNDLYLSAGWQRFGGERRTEFGRAPNIIFGQAQFYW